MEEKNGAEQMEVYTTAGQSKIRERACTCMQCSAHFHLHVKVCTY